VRFLLIALAKEVFSGQKGRRRVWILKGKALRIEGLSYASEESKL
jgi:hypothetical protein